MADMVRDYRGYMKRLDGILMDDTTYPDRLNDVTTEYLDYDSDFDGLDIGGMSDDEDCPVSDPRNKNKNECRNEKDNQPQSTSGNESAVDVKEGSKW